MRQFTYMSAFVALLVFCLCGYVCMHSYIINNNIDHNHNDNITMTNYYVFHSHSFCITSIPTCVCMMIIITVMLLIIIMVIILSNSYVFHSQSLCIISSTGTALTWTPAEGLHQLSRPSRSAWCIDYSRLLSPERAHYFSLE